MGEFVLLGLITHAHGLDGAVKIKSFTERPADLAGYGSLWDESGKCRFALSLLGNPKKDMLLVRIAGVKDRSAAEMLQGQKLYAKRSQMPPLRADEFYQADLIGLRAEDSQGPIGKVIAIDNYGAGDLLTIKLDEGGELVLPFQKSFVPFIDISKGRLTVNRPVEVEAGDE